MRLPLALLALLAPEMAHAQQAPAPALRGDAITTTTAGTPTARTLPARQADVLNVRDFGALGTGVSRTAQQALGITTLAQLAAIPAYSWVSAYPYGQLFNLPSADATASGSTVLSFATTATVGISIATTGSNASGQDIILMSTWGVTIGDVVSGHAGIPGGATVTQVFGGSIRISANLTATVPSATRINFAAASPAIALFTNSTVVATTAAASAGATVLTLNRPVQGFANGIAVLGNSAPYGTTMTATGIPVGATIAATSGNTLTLSAPLTADIPIGATLAIQSSGPTGQNYFFVNALAGTNRIPTGAAVLGTCAPSGTTMQSWSGNVITTTAPLAAPGVPGFCPLSSLGASWTTYVLDPSGISEGMRVTGTGVPADTFVEHVNLSTHEVRFSRPIAPRLAAGTTLTFVQSWIDRVEVGMRVTGAGIAANTTVSAVNTSTGAVTLSQATTAALVAPTPIWAATPAARGSTVTFWRQHTDAEARALEMDTLGTIAAVRAATVAGGGTVDIPAGQYLIDQTVVFDVAPRFPFTPAGGVILRGAGENGTALIAARDLGPGRYMLSCGDPTARDDNARGMWADGGQWCFGQWSGMRLAGPAGRSVHAGVRPYIGTAPVQMNGVLHGPRRDMHYLDVSGFAIGIESWADHTVWDHVWARDNWIGMRLAERMTVLYGDLHLNRVWFAGNSWAGISIAPSSYLNGIMDKPYVAANPWGIYCEPGAPRTVTCMQGTVVTQPNMEWAGCGLIRDGNLTPSALGTNAARSIFDTVFSHGYFSSSSGTTTRSELPEGCTFRDYIAVFGVYGLEIRGIWPNAFAPVAGANSALIRASRTDNFTLNRGGALLSGGGMRDVAAAYAAACGQLVTGFGDSGSEFFSTRSEQRVVIETPGVWRARPRFFVDAGQTTMPLGLVMEDFNNSGRLSVRRAGTGAAGTMRLAGVSVVAGTACNMNGKTVLVASQGAELPVRVGAGQSVGGLLKVDTATPGQATAATSVTDGQVLGVVSDNNSGSTSQVFVSTLGPQ